MVRVVHRPLQRSLLALAAAFLFAVPAAWAQTTAAPIESAPLPPITAPADGVPAATPASPAPTLAPAPILMPETVTPLTSLAPPASESTLPDSLIFTPKPAVILRGQSTWEGAYDHLREAFTKVKAACDKAGIKIVGHPVAVFIETNDTSFHYDAILPVDATPAQRPADFPLELRLGTTPSGKAIRFFHQAPYDEIDGAYEQITAYLDAKEIDVNDAFIEEYLTLGATSDAPTTEINIFVEPK